MDTIGDHVDWIDPDKLRDALHAKADQYIAFMNAFTSTASRSDRNLVIFNIARAAGMQVERLHLFLDQGADALAWCARNLFELDLILRFVLASDENLREWMGQRLYDERELLEAVIDSAPSETEAVSELRQRCEEIDRIAATTAMPMKRFRSTGDLAQVTGRQDEYKAMHKLLSKHVHPSSYLVNEDPRNLHSWYTVNTVLTLAQVYAAQIEAQVRAEARL